MKNSIGREIGIKKGCIEELKGDREAEVVGMYNELAGKVRMDIRTARRNYEVRIARDAQKNAKGLYQLYKTKAR